MIKSDTIYTVKMASIWFWVFVLIVFSSILLMASYGMRVSRRLAQDNVPDPIVTLDPDIVPEQVPKNEIKDIIAISSGAIMISTGEKTVMTSSLPVVSKSPIVAMPIEKVNNVSTRKTCPDFTTKAEMLADFHAGNTRLDGNGDGEPCTTIKYKE